jgi:hypothetical protein
LRWGKSVDIQETVGPETREHPPLPGFLIARKSKVGGGAAGRFVERPFPATAATLTVAGDPYTLWIYVPKGVSISQVGARTKGRSEVPVQHELSGNSLRMTFVDQPEPVQWEVEFQASATR